MTMPPPSEVLNASQGLGSSKYNPVLIDCGESPYGSRENPIYIVDCEAIYGYPKRQSTEPGSPEPPIHVPAPGGAVLVDASVQTATPTCDKRPSYVDGHRPSAGALLGR
ncbi:uncharacterized protein ATNIH1004_008463 [Aspergillus tanneri]|uniref:Uncharacterized protein n=1 Tax=Aspergillus tanneri TaxID=1220188 RepID=A0A5M9MG06_9EURO|nr:uncharacterized protein ATNIH1004_008463 [Aspergillus tanneri]KAA8644264.1 hypothetical protein ATNIH1004_008463 [Aspergillus tanneri]